MSAPTAPGRGSGPADTPTDASAPAAVALLVASVGALLVVGLVALSGADRPVTVSDPGPATTLGLPLARYAQDALAVLVVGAALVAALAIGRPLHSDDAPRAPAVLGRARALLVPLAAAWAAVTVVVYVLTASDVSGRSLVQVVDVPLQRAFLGLPQAQAQLLVLLAAVLVLLAGRVTAHPAPAAVTLGVATLGLLPPAFVGHSASAEDHTLAVASLAVHLVGGALWVGGLAVLAVAALAGPRSGSSSGSLSVVRSFSTLALVCAVSVGVSGLLNGSLRVTAPEQLLSTTYGLLLLGKAVGLAVLVGFGWWHRRRSLVRLAAGAGRAAFVRLAVVELVVMALVVAAAVVLARTPPPLA